MSEVLPPLASWAGAKGIEEQPEHVTGLTPEALKRMRKVYLGNWGNGDSVEYEIHVEQAFDVMIEVECEYKNNDPSSTEIRTCQTTITPANDSSYTINENAHYFPDDSKPSGQTSYITLVLRKHTIPEIVASDLIGRPLSTAVEFSPDFDRLIGDRLIHSVINLDDNVIIETIAVNGTGMGAA